MRQRAANRLVVSARGSSLLELVVALAIIAPLMSAAGAALIRSMHTHARMQRAEQGDLLTERLHSLLTRVMHDVDSHRLSLVPVLHQGGTIRYSDRTPYPLSLNPAVAPDGESDAITGLELLSHAAQRTTALLWTSGETSEVVACPPRTLPPTVRSMVGLGVEGLSELRIGTRTRLPSGCARYLLTMEKSVSLPQSVATDQALILIPVARHYTIYRDRSKRIRYLAHAGSDTVENQPIINNAPRLSFSFGDTVRLPLHSFIKLQAQLHFSEERTISLSYIHNLGRRSLAVVTARELTRLDPHMMR